MGFGDWQGALSAAESSVCSEELLSHKQSQLTVIKGKPCGMEC